MQTEELLDKYKDLFDRYKEDKEPLVAELAGREYVFADIEKADVLFIGINPSFLEGDSEKGYSYPVQQALKQYPKHYAKFQELAKWEEEQVSWTYMDMLAVRETNQSRVLQLLQSRGGLRFIVEQLKITRKLIEYIQPKMIVVCNSGARPFWGLEANRDKDGDWQNLWLGYQFAFDMQFGVEVITGIRREGITMASTTALFGVPCLFTGSLTYADKSTKKRLAWQIHQVMKHYTHCFGQSYADGISRDILLDIVSGMTKEIEAIHTRKPELVKAGKYEQAVNLRMKELKVWNELKETLIRLS